MALASMTLSVAGVNATFRVTAKHLYRPHVSIDPIDITG
jgi:hypothetical protein